MGGCWEGGSEVAVLLVVWFGTANLVGWSSLPFFLLVRSSVLLT
jgi:hypothetical protein